ncbi:hypothetical protein DLJ53_19945 [Acuticoccus sediminis]|uniref:Peptidase S8/S53 domain-containing protein n=1 Tax=Acuticoccus sediminis TaxID=2184697 RepID=A0A8B2NKH9_9HYPH|nr:S8 family serine peptidase [Acuticoccus sediminis]RAI00006.1 hypothetical protein DLJ53_19945 [Acuticoccus sediminis]
MATLIVIPRQRSAALAQAASLESADSLHSASLQEVQRLVAGTEFAGRPIMTERGLVPSGREDATETGAPALESARGAGAPRVLSALGVVLLENPSDETLGALSADAEIVPNIAIPAVTPVAEATEATCNPWHLDKINVQAARAQNLTGKGVRIGVLDTGVEASHQEFAGKNIQFAEFNAAGDLISTTPRDAGTHGTHVCGLAAGRTVGVAPDASLSVAAVLTTLNAQGRLTGFLAQIMAGLNWLAHSNFASAAVPISRCPMMNASLGGAGFNNYLLSSLQIIQSAPAAFLFAAIGNAGRSGVNNHGSPGNYQITCGIGATDINDDAADFSDWGIENGTGVVKPDMSAPGVDICSSVPGNTYGLKSGTSMATPIVAGAAALVVEKHPALARNPMGLHSRMLSLTDPAPAMKPTAFQSGFNKVGRGRLDLTNL